MLCYKAWLETRSRFLIALIGITAMCAYSVFHGDKNTLPITGIEWYNGVLHRGHSVLVLLWTVAVILIGMGGLLREKALGSSLFTLSLPVSRTRLILVRIAIAAAQAVTLVIVPWIAMYLVDEVFGKVHSVPQAIFRVVLLLSGGLIFFALAILISSVVEGEYTAPVACFGLIALMSVALADRPLRTYNPWIFMTGGEYLQRQTMLLAGPIPWAHAAANVAVACALLLLAIRLIQKRDLT